MQNDYEALSPPSFVSTQDIAQPPYSIEAEASVIGALLIDNGTWEHVCATITAEDFYRAEHQLIFEELATQITAGKQADVITVTEAISRKGKVEQVGGVLYLNQLAQYVPGPSNVRRYAELVREHSVLRQLIRVSTKTIELARSPKNHTVQDILEKAEKDILAIGESTMRSANNVHEIQNVLGNLLDQLQERADNPVDIVGVSTGFIDLDRMTSGLQPGDLVVLAARPSMGKTSFAVNIAEHVALQEGLPVAIFSMEMSAEQLGVRIAGSVGRIPQNLLRTGALDGEQWQRMSEVAERIMHAQISIDETPAMTAAEVRASARRIARKSGGKLGLIVVDYLQLMSGSAVASNENRATVLGEISRGLKMLAKEMQCPVIALSQLNRSVEQRTDKRPLMSDLRESGAIEQDADVIMFIYRDDYYHPDSKEPNVAEIIIGKQRNGPTGTIKLYFQKDQTRFENLGHEL